MNCSECGHESEASAKFCSECGNRFILSCPTCGVAVKEGAKFCSECGASLQPSPLPAPAAAALGGEKKHITVLFADVAGSMDLQERLDAEVWAQIMGRFVSILAEGVRKYGGTVDKFTGDGIMALFGAPVAQEDHARRACHAAWHLTKTIGELSAELGEEHGVELQVRLGLNSGEVVVGRVGEDVTLDPTALGHTVGLAQRMEAMAEPGKAYLSEYSARLVERWFRLEDFGARTVKGATEPIRVYGLGPPVSLPLRRTVGTAPLVGRERELAALDDALAMAMEGQAQVVGVVGEAGVGKSRLCEEFAESCRARGITVRRAAGVSHGREIPLLPILALHREYFGISDVDEPATARRKVSERLLALDPGLEEMLPLMFDFLEVPDPDRPVPRMAPEVRMGRIFGVVRRIASRRSGRETLVLIFEDLHWFDPQSQAFLERLIETYPGSRTLVITNFRPEFSAAWMRHSYYRQLPLASLREAAVSELLGGLLGIDLSLAPLVPFVQERTGGNPFFVEEVVRALIEDGTLAGGPGTHRLTRPLHEIRVPPSVQAVLAARIDRLRPEDKVVLQSAAVIGRTFDRLVLASVTESDSEVLERSLSALCAAELLQATGNESKAEYRFWHPLTQDVAYQSMLADRRRRLHAAVGTALAADSSRRDELAAVVAAHFEAAGEDLEAARWTARAAIRAWDQDHAEAVRRWRQTIAFLDRVDSSEEAIRLGVRARVRLIHLGSRRAIPAEEVDILYADGRRLAAQLDDSAPLGLLTGVYATIQLGRGQLSAGLSSLLEGMALAGRGTDAWASLSVGPPFIRVYTGPLGEAGTLVDEAIDALQGDPTVGRADMGYSPLLFNGATRCEVLALTGRLGEATSEAERLIVAAETDSSGEVLVCIRSLLPRLAFYAGSDDAALGEASKAVERAEELGSATVWVRAMHALGVANLLARQHHQAITIFTRTLDDARRRNVSRWEEASFLTYLALTYMEQGNHGEAARLADEAVTVSHRQGAQVVESFALLGRAHVRRRTAQSDDRDVREDLHAALELIQQTGAVTYEPFIHEELGRLHDDDKELGEALRLYRQVGATGHARRLEAELSARSGPGGGR
jgi:adenylate cyclase